jgi:hypothetical protein
MIRSLILLSIIALYIPVLFAQQTPHGGTPRTIPGIIEAEEYDRGGEGVAYHDIDAQNQGGQFRTSEGVDIETCSAGGYSVGWTNTGEWIEYTVNVLKAGNYTLRVLVASAQTGGAGHISFNDHDVTGIQTVPNTGGWQTWVIAEIPHIQLDTGVQVMKLTVDNSGFNISYFQFAEEIDWGKLPEPNFSSEHGFYSSPFDLIVSCDSAGSIIRYTLNGSDPRNDTSTIEASSPLTIRIDPTSTQNRASTPAVIVRAYATVNGTPVTNVGCQTYIFIDQVKNQTDPGGEWPRDRVTINGKIIDYNMDPNVVNDNRYKNLINDALLEIPSICINTDLNNLFDPSIGIYVNPTGDGRDWERPASVELIDPHKKEPGFQINAGLRIRGGYSRVPTGMGGQFKHAFRFFFRNEYGKGKLNYPLFGEEGVSKFDCVDLRTAQNYSWSYMGYSGHVCIFVRELFSRDCQRDMKQPYTRTRQYHLYLNGMYWGLYQTQERPEASYAESYFGGNKDNYDVMKVSFGVGVEATDGTPDAYNQLRLLSNSGFTSNTAYFKAQGRNADGTENINYPVLVNIDNLIDYMLVIFYAGNFDAPVTAFGGNQSPNNFYAIYDRLSRNGFIFFAHDAEHSLMDRQYSENGDYGLDRTGPYYSATQTITQNYFNPQFLHERLSKNVEYQVSFSDHIYKHFFNNGALTPKASQARLSARASEIDTSVIAESARWGDTKWSPARTKDDDWLPSVNWIMNSYFPTRTSVVLQQLKVDNLYPSINPPVFKSGSLEIKDNLFVMQAGDKIRLVNNNTSLVGSIIYTLDGTDPRLIGGAVSASGTDAGDDIELTFDYNTVLKARIKNGTVWSALHEILINTGESLNGLRITEINYNPLSDTTVSGTEFEFIELKNIGSTAFILAGAHFIEGVDYTFPNEAIIQPNHFIVLASNAGQFQKRYGFLPYGEYNQQLDNAGERLTLVDALGDTLFTVRYNDKAPWPVEADGDGYSIVAKNINGYGIPDSSYYWRASLYINGSPGRDDVPTSVGNVDDQTIKNFHLSQNYPNPFNPKTKIEYQVPNVGTQHAVSLRVYDLLGREVAVLVNEHKPAGIFSVTWDASVFPSGVYFYKLETGNYRDVKKLILLK